MVSVVGVCGGTSSGVVCDVGVVLVWCWCSGVVVGGAVVVWWWVVEVEAIKDQDLLHGRLSLEGCHFDFSLEMGNCCQNFDSALVVFYMLTTLYHNSLTLSVIYMHIITQSCSVSSSSNLSPSRLSQV